MSASLGSGRWAFVTNLLLLGLLGAFAWLEANYPNAYYRSVQEDEALEWASFWSFLIAGVVFAVAARRQRRTTHAFPWFLLGLALFCVFVAMEEISWGQRVFGQRPPDYFLERNYQQEINFHNFASTELRLLAFRGVILGYGVLLPLFGLLPRVRRLFERLAIVPPPAGLAPSMLAMFWVHSAYPWKFTGEVVECALGLGFLFAALANSALFSSVPGRQSLKSVGALIAVIVVLAFSAAVLSQNRRSADPANLELARIEAQALRSDLTRLAEEQGKPSITKCGFHKRAYTFVSQYERARGLTEGDFTRLTAHRLPEARAEFFLDPWNSPYWIRDRCNKKKGRRVVFVYSFGPNRSRDSSRWEILGDDIGEYVLLNP